MEALETARLVLRPWRMEDLEDFNAYCQNPEVGPNAGWKPHESLEESRGILEDWLRPDQEDELWAIQEKGSGKVVGSIGLHQDGRRSGVPGCRMVGYVLARPCWGKGYMTEAVAAVLDYAFRRERLSLVTINHFSFNHRSRRVIEKSGFRYEGTLRRGAVLYDGRVTDLVCYSMTPGEYRLHLAKKAGLRLALPEEVPQGEVLRFQEEWQGDPNPSAAFLRDRSYQQWLRDSIAGRSQASEGRVTETLFFLVNREGRVAGALDLRHQLNQYLLKFAGHIGYGLLPGSRGRGWAPMMLALGLEKAKERGLSRVLVTCDDQNLASAGTIEACGGVLENKLPEEGRLTRRYWIDL